MPLSTTAPAKGAADDGALIVVLTARPSSATALEQELTRQHVPHDLERFDTIDALLAFLDAAPARRGRAVDAVLVDLRKFSGALPSLAARQRELAMLVAAFPADAVETATVEAASSAGAILLGGDLSERDSVLDFTAALVDHWFGDGQSLSRKAK